MPTNARGRSVLNGTIERPAKEVARGEPWLRCGSCMCRAGVVGLEATHPRFVCLLPITLLIYANIDKMLTAAMAEMVER